MPKEPRLKVVKESSTGLNQKFKDNKTNEVLNRGEVNKRINQGVYEDYHVMHRDGKNIPRSNPDSSKNNNLD